MHLTVLNYLLIISASIAPNQCNLEKQFQCQSSGICIPKSWHCDGTPDCDDRSDEPESCGNIDCPANFYKCNSSQCIFKVRSSKAAKSTVCFINCDLSRPIFATENLTVRTDRTKATFMPAKSRPSGKLLSPIILLC